MPDSDSHRVDYSRPIFLINTGSPRSAQMNDVTKYLNEFLSDPHIITLPKWIRLPLVKGVIVPLSRKGSSERYTDLLERTEGVMPLPHYTNRLAEMLQERTGRAVIPLYRFGQGSRSEVKAFIERHGVTNPHQITLLPLFPQFTYSAAVSCLEYFHPMLSDFFPQAKVYSAQPFYHLPEYIEAMADSMPEVDDNTLYVASFHGIPLNHQSHDAKRGYDYWQQCHDTAEMLFDRIGVSKSHRRLTFQSKTGHTKWLSPMIEEALFDWAKEGYEHVVVVAPAFFCDCLETIYSLEGELADELYRRTSGVLTYVRALNDSPEAVEVLQAVLNHTEQ